ncbi:hypothetical protein NPIL_140671 [Nephila pilipes]|uniref:Uncharacterized protein n=1 Tax=Nephila pilipes TaxID=299642 RepID=A0A8X6T848_NEPPI|nr:hypothetical protein NPIL_140671 [Nephila pilipes]
MPFHFALEQRHKSRGGGLTYHLKTDKRDSAITTFEDSFASFSRNISCGGELIIIFSILKSLAFDGLDDCRLPSSSFESVSVLWSNLSPSSWFTSSYGSVRPQEGLSEHRTHLNDLMGCHFLFV